MLLQAQPLWILNENEMAAKSNFKRMHIPVKRHVHEENTNSIVSINTCPGRIDSPHPIKVYSSIPEYNKNTGKLMQLYRGALEKQWERQPKEEKESKSGQYLDTKRTSQIFHNLSCY